MSSSINGNGNINIHTTKDTYEVAPTGDMDKTLSTIKQSGQAITGISYTAGDGRKEVVDEQDVREFLKSLENFDGTIDPSKVTQEMAEKLGIACQNVVKALGAFVEQMASKMTLSNETTEEDLRIESLIKRGALSDFDIRELMKLLIKAFSQLINAQREITLNNVNGILAALKEKTDAMKQAAQEKYDAAIAQAQAQLIAGCIQVAGAAVSMVASCGSAWRISQSNATSMEKISTQTQSKLKYWEALSELGKAISSGATIATAIGSGDAAEHTLEASNYDVEATQADARMEVLRKMQEENTNQLKELLDFISTLLQMMQQLQQNASSTEKSIVQA